MGYHVLFRTSTIKRCTCVNKRKKSGSRWTLWKNIDRCRRPSSVIGDRNASEDQFADWGLRPSATPGWAIQAKMRKCCYGQEKNFGQYSSLSLLPLISHHTQQNITLSRIKFESCIFVKKCIRSLTFVFIFAYIIVDDVSVYICICIREVVCGYTTPLFSQL